MIRISGLTTEEVPEETEIALQVADDYAAELLPFMDIGWQYPTNYGESDPADNSGLPKEMAGAWKKLLAFQLVEFYGKTPSPMLANLASEGMKSIEMQTVTVEEAYNPPTLPYGSGNEQDYRDRKFYYEPPSTDGASDVFRNDVLNYTEDLSAWLVDETIVSAEWVTNDNGITVANVSFDDTTTTAELKFNQIGGYTVCITLTKTNSSDVFTINKNFIIHECNTNGIRYN